MDLDSEFSFECRKYGKCFQHQNAILFTSRDIFNIANRFQMITEEVINQYAETYIGSSSRIPVVHMVPRGKMKVAPSLRMAAALFMIANRYTIIGFDTYEEDYFSLTVHEQELAYSEVGKRLMRNIKAKMISVIGQCLGILIAFLDVRHSYDYLQSTVDILRDENTSLLQLIKEIDKSVEVPEISEPVMTETTYGRRAA